MPASSMAALKLPLSCSMKLLAIVAAVWALVPRTVICTRDELVPLVIWHGMGEYGVNDKAFSFVCIFVHPLLQEIAVATRLVQGDSKHAWKRCCLVCTSNHFSLVAPQQ